MSYGKWKALQPRVEIEVDVYKPRRPCRICGTDIPPEVNGNAIYCSHECYQEGYRIKSKERYLKKKMMAAKADATPRFCGICGKEIPIDAHGNAVYCSTECAKERHRIGRREYYYKQKERMMANGKV